MRAIYHKELQSFFHSMIGYIYISFMLLIIGILFTAFNLQGGRAEFSYTLNSLTLVLIVVTPILTMRSLGDERRLKTDQLLLTAPITGYQIVFGKFLSIFTLFSIPVLIALLCPYILSLYGDIPLLSSYACFPPFLLMGGCCIAIGIFISSFTENPILCAVETFGVLFLLYLIPSLVTLLEKDLHTAVVGYLCFSIIFCTAVYIVLRSKPVVFILFISFMILLSFIAIMYPTQLAASFTSLIEQLALFEHFEQFTQGIFSIRVVVYYVTIIITLLFFSVQSLEIRRWN